MRSKPISKRLTLDDAVDILRRRRAGEAYSRIAATHDVNQGRVADVVKGRLHPQAAAILAAAERAQADGMSNSRGATEARQR